MTPNYVSLASSLACATVFKPSPESPVGVSFRQSNDRLFVSRINETSLFAATDIAPGMQVISINNTYVHSPAEAVAVIKGSPRLVTVLALVAGSETPDNCAFVAVAVEKEQPDQPLGIAYSSLSARGGVKLSRRQAECLFDTALEVGMAILTINNKIIHGKSDVAPLLRDASVVTMVACKLPPPTPPPPQDVVDDVETGISGAKDDAQDNAPPNKCLGISCLLIAILSWFLGAAITAVVALVLGCIAMKNKGEGCPVVFGILIAIARIIYIIVVISTLN